MLENFKNQGYILSIATSMSRESLDSLMRKFEVTEFFAATCCCEETAFKPDPAMLYSLLEKLDILPKDALMIGDTESDIIMAERAGMDSVGVFKGKGSRLAYLNNTYLNNIGELVDFLEKKESKKC